MQLDSPLQIENCNWRTRDIGYSVNPALFLMFNYLKIWEVTSIYLIIIFIFRKHLPFKQLYDQFWDCGP